MSTHVSNNLVVLRGSVTSELLHRQLASGAVVVQFDVRTEVSDVAGDVTSVPISWIDPAPLALPPLVIGADVVVVGSIRRRFFRAGGATQSRTEVVAQRVVPKRRTKSVRSAISAAITSLGD